MIPIKSAREAEKMRQSCRVASDILERVIELFDPVSRRGKSMKRLRR